VRTIRAAVYGDVNLNILDGSAIWAQSMVEALSATGRCDTTFLLKGKITNDRLVAPLVGLPRTRIVRPFEDGLVDGPGHELAPPDAVRLLKQLDAAEHFDIVVVRGLKFVTALTRDRHFAGRLWTYLTDIPQSVDEATDERVDALRPIVNASRLLLCQTEDLRTFLEAIVPEACGKGVLYPPVVPPVAAILDEVAARPAPQPSVAVDGVIEHPPVKLVYTGKFAPLWNTLEMTQLPERTSARSVDVEVHMIGDKVHRDPDDPDWFDRMNDALRNGKGVVWHGGMPRKDAMTLTATADIGLSWRHPRMDRSLELSTKVLEYGALGLPVLLNRSRVHEELLGADYPLFVNSTDDVVEAIEALGNDASLRALAVERCRQAAEHFTLERAVERLRTYIDRSFPPVDGARFAGGKLKIGVASHDLKFFTRLLEYFRSVDDVEVRVDEWAGISDHDITASQRLAAWADVVVCEWCTGNAIWYSRNKRPGQRLVVRLHRFELDAGFYRDVQIENVDAVVCVSPYYARLTRERTGWPAEKVITVPNWVDTLELDREKLPGAVRHLGLVGIAPSRKRMDRALDVLAAVRRRDDRFQMFVKSKYPWDYWWIWNKAEERDHYEAALERIRRDPALRGAVVFDPFGPDVAGWLRKIGWVLSTSDDESFHLAPAEGMASRALPVVYAWPGAETIYPDEWVSDSTDAMAERILEISSNGGPQAKAEQARQYVLDNFAVERVCDEWLDVVSPR
jgi:glycosyltransferase involved in cell wall biosynthesis